VASSSSQAEQVQGCLDRLRAGDASARDELIRHAYGRLQRLTRKLLRAYPGVRRWDQTDDVLQNSLLRLLRALNDVRPSSPREFFALTAQQIRRELLDLARRYYGPHGLGANHATRPDDAAGPPPHERADGTHEPASLAVWREFHERVRELPPEELEVVDLLYYQELTQAEAAALLGVTVRTVQRRWQSALLRLNGMLKGQWPGA
jgi:RNA polymerase sigma-70 factor (ECF subfamily)